MMWMHTPKSENNYLEQKQQLQKYYFQSPNHYTAKTEIKNSINTEHNRSSFFALLLSLITLHPSAQIAS